jgi:hypothetical protein
LNNLEDKLIQLFIFDVFINGFRMNDDEIFGNIFHFKFSEEKEESKFKKELKMPMTQSITESIVLQ